VAALGKGTQALASGVESVAGKVETGARTADTAAKTAKAGLSAVRHGEAAIDRMRKGNIMEAIDEGKKAVSDVETAAGGAEKLKKQIERKKKK